MSITFYIQVMIRKTINSILLVIFLFGSVGYSVSIHYCGSAKISSSIGIQAKSCCGDESGTCCHNESMHYQIKDSYVASSEDINDRTNSISNLLIVTADVSKLSFDDIINYKITFIAESPPPLKVTSQLSSIQTYLL